MWNKTIHIVHRNKSINLTGEDGFKRFLRVNSLKKNGKNLYSFRWYLRFTLRPGNRKLPRTKKGYKRRVQTIKRKGQEGNLSKSKWFPSSISNTIICLFHSNMEMWLHLLLIPYSIIKTSPLPPDTVSSNNHCQLPPYLSSHRPLKHEWFQTVSSRVFLPLPSQLQSNLYTIFRQKLPISILHPVASKLLTA